MKDGANYRMVYETLKSEILGGKYSVNFQKRPKCSANVNDRLRGVISAIVLHQGGICKNLILVAEPTDVEAVRRHFRKGRPDADMTCESPACIWLIEFKLD